MRSGCIETQGVPACPRRLRDHGRRKSTTRPGPQGGNLGLARAIRCQGCWSAAATSSSLYSRPSARAYPITARLAVSSKIRIQIRCRTSRVSKPERIVDAQRQAHIDLVTVEFHDVVGVRCRLADGARIVAPRMADLLRAGGPRSGAEMLIRERADMTREGSLAEMLLVEGILVALYSGLPALREKPPVQSPQVSRYFGEGRLLAATIGDSALDPVCNVGVAPQ